jgi:methylamine---glutamate N-methyltransferase subunit A
VCGIVGLHLIDPGLYPRLGELVTPMLDAMCSRGPDSAGVALYDEPLTDGRMRYTVRAAREQDWTGATAAKLTAAVGSPVQVDAIATHAEVITAADEPLIREALRDLLPDAVVVGRGQALWIVKDLGTPAEICARYRIAERHGYQAIGHTRMATESAVTIDHSHPFAPNPDLTVVHNGTFSNYATVRRRLIDAGEVFDTDNDTEVVARFIGRRLAQGDDLGEAMRRVLKDFDGFYTLLVGTRDEFSVLRDAFACKPLVVAETAAYVAVASEYHALAGLPGLEQAGVEQARVFEPKPEEIYAWSR